VKGRRAVPFERGKRDEEKKWLFIFIDWEGGVVFVKGENRGKKKLIKPRGGGGGGVI